MRQVLVLGGVSCLRNAITPDSKKKFRSYYIETRGCVKANAALTVFIFIRLLIYFL